jgi:hypothetical protein
MYTCSMSMLHSAKITMPACVVNFVATYYSKYMLSFVSVDESGTMMIIDNDTIVMLLPKNAGASTLATTEKKNCFLILSCQPLTDPKLVSQPSRYVCFFPFSLLSFPGQTVQINSIAIPRQGRGTVTLSEGRVGRTGRESGGAKKGTARYHTHQIIVTFGTVLIPSIVLGDIGDLESCISIV